MSDKLRKLGIVAILLAVAVVPLLYMAMYEALSRGTIDQYDKCIKDGRAKGATDQVVVDGCQTKFARPVANTHWALEVSTAQLADGLTYCDMTFVNRADNQVVVQLDIKVISNPLHEARVKLKQDVLILPYGRKLLFHQEMPKEQDTDHCSETLFEVRHVGSVHVTKTQRTAD